CLARGSLLQKASRNDAHNGSHHGHPQRNPRQPAARPAVATSRYDERMKRPDIACRSRNNLTKRNRKVEMGFCGPGLMG
ncbi:MAG TPA: hypothetical protein VGL08_02030, partial [Paraburkholderia sp.]